MGTEVPLGSLSNFLEFFEMLEVVYSTRFLDLPDAWSGRTSRDLDYHRGLTESGSYFIYYDPWLRQKIV